MRVGHTVALCVVVVLAIATTIVHAHSTHYELEDRKVCWGDQQPRIYSWHIHVLWQPNDKQMTADAALFRVAFSKQFNVSTTCPSLYHQDQMCLFRPSPSSEGPFPTAQWAVFLRPDQLGYVLPWMLLHRERKGQITTACRLWNITDPSCGFPVPNFDLFLHPNTGCEYEDHGKWHMWGGTPWVLNMAAMDHADPFDNGDADPYDTPPGPMPPPINF